MSIHKVNPLFVGAINVCPRHIIALETCQAAGMTHNHIRLKALHEVIDLIRRIDACRGRRPEIFCQWINWVWIKCCLQHSITFNEEKKSQGVDSIPIDLSNKLLTLNPPWHPPDSSICRSCAVLNALTQLAPSPSAMASCISWAHHPAHLSAFTCEGWVWSSQSSYH